jgi:hypothetical protein
MSVLVVGEDSRGSVGYVTGVSFDPLTRTVASFRQTMDKAAALGVSFDVATEWIGALRQDCPDISWSLSLSLESQPPVGCESMSAIRNSQHVSVIRNSQHVVPEDNNMPDEDEDVDHYIGPEPESYDKRIARELKERQQAYNKYWNDKMEYYND